MFIPAGFAKFSRVEVNVACSRDAPIYCSPIIAEIHYDDIHIKKAVVVSAETVEREWVEA